MTKQYIEIKLWIKVLALKYTKTVVIWKGGESMSSTAHAHPTDRIYFFLFTQPAVYFQQDKVAI